MSEEGDASYDGSVILPELTRPDVGAQLSSEGKQKASFMTKTCLFSEKPSHQRRVRQVAKRLQTEAEEEEHDEEI